MPFQTHPDFQTAIPFITGGEDIYNFLKLPLQHQGQFNKKTCAFDQWDDEERQKFEINVENIDRLFSINKYSIGQFHYYELVVRIMYNKKIRLYVELRAKGNFVFPTPCFIREGLVFISSDAKLFMKLVFAPNWLNKDKICQFLAEDGFVAEKEDEISARINTQLFRRRELSRLEERLSQFTFPQIVYYRKYPPALKYLCQQAVYSHQKLLPSEYYSSQLPKTLIDSLMDFAQTRKVEYKYTEWKLRAGVYANFNNNYPPFYGM